MHDNHSGPAQPVLFFLKSAVRRQITVPGYTRHDGVVVPPHQRFVLVSSDHDDARVLNGQGSHSQRQAHAELSHHAWFHQMPHDHRVAVLLAHATDRQDAASRSAQVSGWKQRALAGQNPTAAQWQAFRALPLERKSALLEEVRAAVGNHNHLSDPGGSVSQNTIDRLSTSDVAPAASPAPAVVPADPADLPTEHDVAHASQAARLSSDAIAGGGASHADAAHLHTVAADLNRRRGEHFRNRGDHTVGTSLIDRANHHQDQAQNHAGHAAASAASDVHVDTGTASAPVAPPAVARVNDIELTRQPDGSWITRTGKHIARASAVGLAADYLAGVPLEGSHLNAMTIDARVAAANRVVHAGSDGAEVVNALFPAGGIMGPQEGDARTINGVSYVLRDGRWHRATNDTAPADSAATPTGLPPEVPLPTHIGLPNTPSGLDNIRAGNARLVAREGRLAHLLRMRDRDNNTPAMRNFIDHLAAIVRSHQTIAAAGSAPSAAVVQRPARVVGARVVASPEPAAASSSRVTSLRAVPVPSFPDTSESNRSQTRRAGQLRAMAEAGDVDGITNFPTSRTRANYARIADYRDALLAAAQGATTAQATAAVAAEIPRPPAITGANMQNSALLAATRKVNLLYDAARRPNELEAVSALLSISTSRGNRYLNAADDYKKALLLHYGRDAAGNPIAGVAARPSTAPALVAAPASRPVPAPAPTPAAPARPAAAPVPPSQNPAIAANPYGLSEAVLGFVPRPNVPLSIRTNGLPAGHSWPHPEMAELNRRYLAQPTDRQTRARNYQEGTWTPPLHQLPPEARANIERVQAEQRARQAAEAASRQAAEETRRRAEMEQIRAAAAAVQERMANVDTLFKPTNAPGHNITSFGVMDDRTKENAARVLGVSHEQVQKLLATLVADYGGTTTFSMRVSASGGELEVGFSGNDGTRITRNFSRSSATGKLTVYHAYFQAGRTGGGSGKHLFRTSMGVYMGLGVDSVGVTANIDVGGYAWARFGYKPKNWDGLRSILSSRLDNLARYETTIQVRVPGPNGGPDRRESRQVPALAPNIVEKIRAVLRNDNPAALWAIADMKAGGREIGKELLLGTSWSGIMKLSDRETMDRLKRYVAPRPAQA